MCRSVRRASDAASPVVRDGGYFRVRLVRPATDVSWGDASTEPGGSSFRTWRARPAHRDGRVELPFDSSTTWSTTSARNATRRRQTTR